MKVDSNTQAKALKNKDNNYSHLEKEYYKKYNTRLCDPFAILPQKVKHHLSATVIIPTWNSESSILKCLTSIEQSSFNIKHQNKLQVIVIDDGSQDNTWNLLKKSKLSLNLTIIKQKSSGQTKALNTGISIAKGDIIISCDSDMVLGYYAIEHFMAIHNTFPDVLLVGFRSDTSNDDPRVNKNYMRKNGTHKYSDITLDERISFSSSGWPMNMCLTSNHFKNLGNKKGLWLRDSDPWLLSDLVFGAFFSLQKSTYKIIGGYDERLKGWGCADGYLASKAIAVGNFVIPIYSASGLHIKHDDRNKNKWIEYKKNRKLFKKLIKISKVNEFPNWLDKAKSRIIESKTFTPIKIRFNNNKTGSKNISKKYFKLDLLLSTGRYKEIIKIINSKKSKNKKLLSYLGEAKLFYKKYDQAIKILREIKKPSQKDIINLLLAEAGNNDFISAKKL